MILYAYIVKELIFPFLLATGVITSILLMNEIYQFIPFLRSSGIEIVSIFQMVLFSLPSILMITAPISLMMGVYIGINRVSSDYELVVIRSSGVSLAFLFKPVLFVAFVVAIFVMVQAFYLGPLGMTRLEELKFNILKNQTKINLSVGRINNFFGKVLIHVFGKEGEVLEGIFIADWESPGNNAIIESEKGRIHFDENDQKVIFQLEDGKIHYSFDKMNYRIIKFDRMNYDLVPPNRRRKDLPQRFRDLSNASKSKLQTELMVNELLDNIERSPPGSRKTLEYLNEFHGRIVAILSCIGFAVFSLSIGIYDPRNPKSGTIVYMIVMMVVYFLILFQARSLLLLGRTPAAGLYLPFLLTLIVGFINYYRINHDMNSFKEQIRTLLTTGRAK
ncbi:MAG: LptF/LptG family permease [Proteobacteria bacterium]|nr:LptF/LptG family permease [Pseudomonadota bacterium]